MLRLPAEIRNMIYTYTIGGNLIPLHTCTSLGVDNKKLLRWIDDEEFEGSLNSDISSQDGSDYADTVSDAKVSSNAAEDSGAEQSQSNAPSPEAASDSGDDVLHEPFDYLPGYGDTDPRDESWAWMFEAHAERLPYRYDASVRFRPETTIFRKICRQLYQETWTLTWRANIFDATSPDRFKLWLRKLPMHERDLIEHLRITYYYRYHFHHLLRYVMQKEDYPDYHFCELPSLKKITLDFENVEELTEWSACEEEDIKSHSTADHDAAMKKVHEHDLEVAKTHEQVRATVQMLNPHAQVTIPKWVMKCFCSPQDECRCTLDSELEDD